MLQIIQIFDKATSVKTIYKQSQGQAYQAMSLPNLGHYILDLNPSTVSAETDSVASPFQVAIVLGKKENFSSSVYVILKGVGSGTPVTSLRHVPIFVNSD